MPIDLDRRTLDDADGRDLTPEEFFAEDFPRLVAANGQLVAAGIQALNARPLTVEVGDSSWTINRAADSIAITDGPPDGALVVTLTAQQFSDWVQNQMSFNGMLVARELRMRGGEMLDVSMWDSLWIGLLDGWPIVDPDLSFVDRHGRPLDLHAGFAPDDDPADIAHFLREAGYLHLRGWLDPADMAAISADMDRVLPEYVEGDGKSWWATLTDGTRICVRLQEFVEHSPITARILSGEVWQRLRQVIAGPDELVQAPVEGRIIEALFKPLGVVSGPSDLTFHRDCHLGRHMYGCSGTTVGIALTPTSEANGSLAVIAGSHRVAVPVEIAKTNPYLPRIALPTEPGDLTVHLSCTLHEATAPKLTERRVMYTGFSLPQRSTASPGVGALSRLRERVTDLLREEA